MGNSQGFRREKPGILREQLAVLEGGTTRDTGEKLQRVEQIRDTG